MLSILNNIFVIFPSVEDIQARFLEIWRIKDHREYMFSLMRIWEFLLWWEVIVLVDDSISEVLSLWPYRCLNSKLDVRCGRQVGKFILFFGFDGHVFANNYRGTIGFFNENSIVLSVLKLLIPLNFHLRKLNNYVRIYLCCRLTRYEAKKFINFSPNPN